MAIFNRCHCGCELTMSTSRLRSSGLASDLRVTWNIDSDNSTIRPIILTGIKVRNLASVFDPSCLNFEKEIWNLKQTPWPLMAVLCSGNTELVQFGPFISENRVTILPPSPVPLEKVWVLSRVWNTDPVASSTPLLIFTGLKKSKILPRILSRPHAEKS